MSAVEKDFDRLAHLDSDGWTANNHYHEFLLRRLPEHCVHVLDVGCGTGTFSRRLASRAAHVRAIDLSPEMIRVARSRSGAFHNLEFEVADVMSCSFPAAHFDCIATVATLHHVPINQVLVKVREWLKPGGVLIVLDLLETERSLFTAAGVRDAFLDALALGLSWSLSLFHNRRLRPPREVRAAWEAHGKSDSYLSISEARDLYEQLFPKAAVCRQLPWRYSVVWQKPSNAC